MRRLVTILIPFLLAGGTALAETASIEAGRDATIIEEPDGALANGAGPALFVGRTGQSQGSIRRGLLYFDVAGAVPAHAIIEEARLTLHLTPSNAGTVEIRVHRVMAEWSEGDAASSGGSGAPAGPGDVTWIHRSYDSEFWLTAGGQFTGGPSARLEVAGSGSHTWDDRQLARDVNMWLSAPHRNFGWLLVGDETASRTVQRFASREDPDPQLRPVLEVTYRTVGRP